VEEAKQSPIPRQIGPSTVAIKLLPADNLRVPQTGRATGGTHL
jgi:hypothetical protein